MHPLHRYLIAELVHHHRSGELSRRDALAGLASVVGVGAAGQLLAGCAPHAPLAAPAPVVSPDHVPPDDPAVACHVASIPAEDGPITAAVARPASGEPAPVVLVCHANRGLNAYTRDVTRRLAKRGYVAAAVDLLSRAGGTDALSERRIWRALGEAPPGRHARDFAAAIPYLRAQPWVVQRFGMIGFCFGGGVTWQVAIEVPELLAAVPFYGVPPAADRVGAIRAEVLGIYAGLDRIVPPEVVPPIAVAMELAGARFESRTYPDANHAFHDDTGGAYHPEAAAAAWTEAMGWLDRCLRAIPAEQ